MGIAQTFQSRYNPNLQKPVPLSILPGKFNGP